MNLYRSFGNLMESWVTEGNPSPDTEWLGINAKDSLTPSSDAETNLRSESVDSGVETASCDTSLSASGSVSADNAEMDLFTSQKERLSPALSQSPVLSSNESPQLSTSRVKENSTSLLLVERALERTDSLHLTDKPLPITADEVVRRRPRVPFMPKRHSSDLVRSQKPDSFGERKTANPSVLNFCRRPTSLNYDRTRSESFAVGDRKDLSPGLDYLEQVCQMLEDVARQQMQSRTVQTEMEALWEDQDDQVPDTCQSDSEAAEEELPSRQRLEGRENVEDISGEPKTWKYGHFRQRSASDTALSTLHLRKLNTHNRGQLLSTNDLLEDVEEEQEKQEFTKTGSNKPHKNWRLKFGSFGRVESSIFGTKSQQTQPSEKSSARRRLSQLFRRRRKTLPA